MTQIPIPASEQRMHAAAQGLPLANASANQVGELFAQLAVLTGQKVPPSEAVALIAGFLVEAHSKVTCQDIALAVRMNLANQLPERIEPFGEFSAAYIGKVVAQYMPLRGRALIKYRQIEESQQERAALPAHEVSDQEWEVMLERDIAYYRSGRMYWEYSAARMVGWLYESGRVTDDDFSPEEWRKIRVGAKDTVMHRRNLGRNGVNLLPEREREVFVEEVLLERRRVLYGLFLKRKVREAENQAETIK